MSESARCSRSPNNIASKSTKNGPNVTTTTATNPKKAPQPSRLPIRSQSLSGQKAVVPKCGLNRATSPSPSSRTLKKKRGQMSVDNVNLLCDNNEALVEHKTEPEKFRANCKPKFEPRINKIVQQRINRIRSGTPPKSNIGNVSINPMVANRRKLTNANNNSDSQGDTFSVTPVPLTRAMELNPVRAIETQYKKLQNFQTDFMRKLRQTGQLTKQKLQQYKFVAIVINANCKLVVHEDELLNLPKALPAESVNDLKERCRSVVDSGFTLMFDNLNSVQRSKDEADAKAAREDLRKKMQTLLNRETSALTAEISRLCSSCSDNKIVNDLQRELDVVRAEKNHLENSFLEVETEHCHAINQLRTDHDEALLAETEKRDRIIADLQKSLSKLQKEKDQIESSLLDYKNELGDLLSPLAPDNTNEILKRDKIISELKESLRLAEEEKESMAIQCSDVDVNDRDSKSESSETIRRGQILVDLKTALRKAVEEKKQLESRLEELNSKQCKFSPKSSGSNKSDEIIADLKKSLRKAEDEKDRFEIKCSEHNNAINQLKLDHALTMSTETGKRDKIISELKRSLRKAEDDKEHFDRLFTEVKTKNADLRSQLSLDEQLNRSSELKSRDAFVANISRCLSETHNEIANHVELLAERVPSDKEDEETTELLRAEMERLKTINKRLKSGLEQANSGIDCSRSNKETETEPNMTEDGIVAADRTIAELRTQVNNLEHHRNLLNSQVKNIMGQHVAYDELNASFKQAQKEISELKEKLSASEKLLYESTQSESELRNELKLSKEDLRNFEIQVTRLNEQLERDRQLLLVRADMINALQRHDEESRNKLDEMYSQVKEKNSQITQMNDDLSCKKEEFQNLFNTLSSKQSEVRRQEHIIKLLQDNNDRSSMLRIKQEEKNAVMQDEINQLKRSMRDYAKIIIGNGGQNCFEVVTASEVLKYHADQEKPNPCPDVNCQFHQSQRRLQYTTQEEQMRNEEERKKLIQLATTQLQQGHKRKLKQQQKQKDDDTTVLLEPKFKCKYSKH